MARSGNWSDITIISRSREQGTNCNNLKPARDPTNRRSLKSMSWNRPNGKRPFVLATSMSASSSSRDRGTQRIWQGSSQYIDTFFGDSLGISANTSSAERSLALDYASYLAVERLYGQLGSVDLSETLVEAKQTAKMTSLANTMYNMTGEAIGRFGLAKVVASGYLYMNFGVKPLVSDIFNTLETIDRQASRIYTIKCGNTQWYRARASSNDLGSSYRGKVTVRYSCKFRSGKLDSLSNYTSMDPAYIAWTALPWSWFADYIYNIGGYLRQMEKRALYNTAFLGGSRSVKTIENGDIISGIRDYNIGNYPCLKPYHLINDVTQKVENYSRSPMSVLPAAQKPRFSLDLSSGQLMNTAAAITGLLAGEKFDYRADYHEDGKRKKKRTL